MGYGYTESEVWGNSDVASGGRCGVWRRATVQIFVNIYLILYEIYCQIDINIILALCIFVDHFLKYC